MFTSLLRKSMRRLGAAVPAHVRRVRFRGLLALRPSLDSLATAGKHALRMRFITVASDAKLARPTEEYSEYSEGGRTTICGAQQVRKRIRDAC